MADLEVERLRRLRASALRLRAVARALSDNKRILGGDVLRQGRLVPWRVARTASGWLRAHPYARYQQDASLGTVLGNSLVAMVTSLAATSRQRAVVQFAARVRAVLREIDDARALTRSPALSDSLGRSQGEFRALLAALDFETQFIGPNPRGSLPISNEGPGSEEGSPFLTI